MNSKHSKTLKEDSQNKRIKHPRPYTTGFSCNVMVKAKLPRGVVRHKQS